MANDPTVVTVTIAGEEYKIRAQATPDYTRECADYVNRTISEILEKVSLAEPHKAAILAALAVTDELFQVRGEVESLRREVRSRAEKLAHDIEAVRTPGELAPRP